MKSNKKKYIIIPIILVLILMPLFFMVNVPSKIRLKAGDNVIAPETKSIVLTFSNHSLRAISFGDHFRIEKKNDNNGEWELYNDKSNDPFRSGLTIGTVPPFGKKQFNCPLEQYSDQFEPGHFRIVMDNIWIGDNNPDNYFEISCEIDIRN